MLYCVLALLADIHTDVQAVQQIYSELLGGAPVRSEMARRQLHTEYHEREAISSTNFDF